MERRNTRIFLLTAAALCILLLSVRLTGAGILLHPLKQYTWLKGVHGLAGIVFFISVMVHVYQCRSQAGK